MRCGWCGNRDDATTSNCARCGGPLPDPSGEQAGHEPPPQPRSLPPLFSRRELFSANSGVWFGLIFGGFCALFPLIFLSISVFAPVMLPAAALSSVFPLPGAFIVYLSRRRARRRIEVLENGRASLGTVESVALNLGERHNGRHPWRLSYLFEVDGRRYGGSVSSYDADIKRFVPGGAIHVVYLATDPERSDVWPIIPR